jgi:7-carboxy-7-deazaguanine synthase
MTYPVHEMFSTFQGEGVHMGKPAFFVRLYGCPVHCPWCDSAGTWHPNHKPPAGVRRMTARQIWDEAEKTRAQMLVVTGGEPAIHDLKELTSGSVFMPTHLETSGAFEIKGLFDWVTVSPKRWKLPIAQTVKRANEFKFIIETPEDIPFYTQTILELGHIPNNFGRDVPIWLHPEWSQHENPEVLRAISNAVKESLYPYRAGWQLHKLYRVDALDSRSAPLVPLGGNPDKGY